MLCRNSVVLKSNVNIKGRYLTGMYTIQKHVRSCAQNAVLNKELSKIRKIGEVAREIISCLLQLEVLK